MLKNHHFFLSCIDRFGEKSQKLLKMHDFENWKVVFEPFLQNGLHKILAIFLSQNGKAADNGSIVKLSGSIDKNQLFLADI